MTDSWSALRGTNMAFQLLLKPYFINWGFETSSAVIERYAHNEMRVHGSRGRSQLGLKLEFDQCWCMICYVPTLTFI